MFFYRTNPNDPRTDVNLREDKPVLDRKPPQAVRDGHTVLSSADRESGHRPYASGRPEMFGRRTID